MVSKTGRWPRSEVQHGLDAHPDGGQGRGRRGEQAHARIQDMGAVERRDDPVHVTSVANLDPADPMLALPTCQPPMIKMKSARGGRSRCRGRRSCHYNNILPLQRRECVGLDRLDAQLPAYLHQGRLLLDDVMAIGLADCSEQVFHLNWRFSRYRE